MPADQPARVAPAPAPPSGPFDSLNGFLWLGLIVYGSLYPWRFDFSTLATSAPWFGMHLFDARLSRSVLRDIVLNVLLYMPLGAAWCTALCRYLPRWAATILTVAAASTLSTAIEFLQVYVPGRDPSFRDVLCNAAGAALGAVLAARVRRAWRHSAAASPHAGSARLLLLLFAVAQFYPFFPSFTFRQWHTAAAALAGGGWSLLDTAAFTGEYVGVLALLAAASPVSGPLASAVAAVLWAAARMSLPGRPLTWAELIAAGLAVLLGAFLHDVRRLRAALWFMSATVLIRQLAPFHFSAEASRFSWIPFAATFTAERVSAVVVLARKAFDYGAVLWLMRRAGAPRWTLVCLLPGSLLLLEWAQRYLPGRTSEITDPLLAALLGWMLSREERASSPSRIVSGSTTALLPVKPV